jgi:hypothetical protein
VYHETRVKTDFRKAFRCIEPWKPCVEVCSVCSYKNADYFGEMAWFPPRCDIFWALFGYISSLYTFLPCYNEEVTLDLRIKRVGVADFGTRRGSIMCFFF